MEAPFSQEKPENKYLTFVDKSKITFDGSNSIFLADWETEEEKTTCKLSSLIVLKERGNITENQRFLSAITQLLLGVLRPCFSAGW